MHRVSSISVDSNIMVIRLIHKAHALNQDRYLAPYPSRSGVKTSQLPKPVSISDMFSVPNRPCTSTIVFSNNGSFGCGST